MSEDIFAELQAQDNDIFAELESVPDGGNVDLAAPSAAPQDIFAELAGPAEARLPSARLRRLRDRLAADPRTDPAQLKRIQRMLVQFTADEGLEEPAPESLTTQFGSAGAQAGLLPIAGLSRVLSTKTAARINPAVAIQQAGINVLFGKDALRRFSDEVLNVIGVLEPVVDPSRPNLSGIAQASGAVVGSFSTGIPTYRGGLAATDAAWDAAQALAPNMSKRALARVGALASRAERAGPALDAVARPLSRFIPGLAAGAGPRAGRLVANLPREFVAGTIATGLTSPDEFSTWQGVALASAFNLLGGLDSGVRPVGGGPTPKPAGAGALAGDARAEAVSGVGGLKDADVLRSTPQEIAAFAKQQASAESKSLKQLFGPKGARLYRRLQRMAVSDKSSPEAALNAAATLRRMEGKLSDAERASLNDLGKVGYTAKRLRRVAKIVSGYDDETLGKIANEDLVRQFGELLMTKKPENNISTTYRLKKIFDTLVLRGVSESELVKSGMKYMLGKGMKSADAGTAVAEAIAKVGTEGRRVAGLPEVPEAPMDKPSLPRQHADPEVEAEFQRLRRELSEEKERRVRAEGEAEVSRREAETDPLTGAGNYRALQRAAPQADAAPNWKYALFDVGGLRLFNNGLSHSAGNALMQFAVRTLQDAANNMGITARIFRGASEGADELYVIMNANTLDEARIYRDLVEELFGIREARIGDKSAKASLGGEVAENLKDLEGPATEAALLRRKTLMKHFNDMPLPKEDEQRMLAQILAEEVEFGGPGDIPQRITVRTLDPTPREPITSYRNPVDAAHAGKMGDPGDALETTPQVEGLPKHSQHIQDRIETDPKLDDERIGPVEALDRLYTRMMRKVHPIEQAESTLTEGEGVPAHQSAAAAAQLMNGTAGRVEQMLNFNPFRIDENGNIAFSTTAKALSKILAPLKGRLNEYRRYLVARRTLELAERGIDVGVDITAARIEVAHASADIRRAAEETTAFNNMVLQYWVDAGGLSQAAAEAMKLANQSHVSFRRALGREAGKTGVVDKLRYAALSTPQQIREIVGSKLKILDPIFTTVDNTRRMMRAADLNRVGKQLVEMAEMFPDRAVDLLERVKDAEADASPELIADAGALMRAAKEAGVTIHKEVAAELAATMSDKALLVQGDIMRVWRNGKLEQWKVSKELGHALRSLGPQDINLIFRLLGLPSQFVKVGITANPVFALIQAFAGTFHAAIQSKYGFIPGVDSWIGFINSLRNSQYRQEFLAAGGAFSQLGASEFRTTEAALRTVMPKTGLEALGSIALHPVEALRRINAPLEEAARIGAFIRARKAGASALEAALEARRVDTDFSMIGSQMAALGHMVAFLNPFLQGTDTAIRAAARNPKKLMLVGMAGITLPSIYFWLAGEDDKDVRDRQKGPEGALNWIVRLPGGEIAKIRKPYIYGQVFGNTAEAALDKMFEDDPNAYKRMVQALRDQVTFNLEPNAFQMYRGIRDNRDPLSGNPIYPESLEAAEPFLRSNYATSALSQRIGEAVNVSPAMLDFSIRQLGGTILYDAIKASDAILDTDGASPPTPVKSDWPLLGRLLARVPSQNVEPVRSYYEDADEVTKVIVTLRELEKQNRAEEFVAYAQEHAVELGLAPVYAQTREELSKLRMALSQVRTLPDSVMSRDRKRETVDYLVRQIVEVTRNVNLATRKAKAQVQAQNTASAR